jgi:hypothetical protein
MMRAGLPSYEALVQELAVVPQEEQEKTEIFPVPFCTTSSNFKPKTVVVPAFAEVIAVTVLLDMSALAGERAVAVGTVVSEPIVNWF